MNSRKFPWLYELGQSARSAISADRGMTREQNVAQAELREQFPGIERPNGVALPWYEGRALTATGTTSTSGDQGGMTIGMDVPEIGLAFRDALVLARLGAQIHGGLRANAEFPREK